MFNNNEKRIKELEAKIDEIYVDQRNFLSEASKIMNSVLDSDKRKFMYEIRTEDIELIEDGKKYRAIRKIIV